VQDERLVKTIRVNMLFDFYSELLTDKQQTFLRHYYDDDYSLGEIAAEFKISRQAVYEHIKRAEHMLEEYESKLHLLDKHDKRKLCHERLRLTVETISDTYKQEIFSILNEMEQID
jgi:uncharacterized protein